MNTTKEDLKERISDLDKMYMEQMEEMNNSIETVKILARDSVNTKEKELIDIMDKSMIKIDSRVDENINDMVEERKATISKYEK